MPTIGGIADPLTYEITDGDKSYARHCFIEAHCVDRQAEDAMHVAFEAVIARRGVRQRRRADAGERTVALAARSDVNRHCGP